MLSAINNKEETILSFNLNEEEIEILKKEDLICGCCNEPVHIKKGKNFLKSGKVMITHFAHLKNSDCPYPKESQQHLASKISIYNSLKNYGIKEVWLERTISLQKKKELLEQYKKCISENYSNLSINDTFFGKLLKRNIFRPDVCFIYNEEYIAVEVQKSYLPKEDFLLRTLFYRIMKIKVLWIIPEDVFIEKANRIMDAVFHMNLSDFHKELKKYYFGYIYCWDYNKSQLSVYNINNLTTQRSTGSWEEGEHGGEYWNETGGYDYTYKKLKKLENIHTQNNIIDNFYSNDIKKNIKYGQLIDAKVWTLRINKK